MHKEIPIYQVTLKKKPSPISGIGIFTVEEIPANKEFYLVPFCDIRKETAPRLTRIATGLFVSDEVVLNWVNHSCDPNTELVIGQNRLTLRSKRDIKAGEEITVDYFLNEEQNNLIACKCGSEKCRNFFYTS